MNKGHAFCANEVSACRHNSSDLTHVPIQCEYCLEKWFRNERLWILEPIFKPLLCQGASELRN